MHSLCFQLNRFVLFIFLFFILGDLRAEKPDSLNYRVYTIYPLVDIPLTLAATAGNYLGLKAVDKKPRLDSATIMGLDPNQINRFDRRATRQDADFASQAQKLSDYGMAASWMLPLLLMADGEIRKDWAPLLLLYFETQFITSNLFSWGAAVHIDRIRPLVYHPDVPYIEKTYKRNKNSFYSGHTSTSASASFFAAKVYCDYHPELGNKKYIVYSLALIPPFYTGFFRYKGMKHFPTDVLTGLAVGSTVGVLIPHLHKNASSNLSIVPFSGQVNGLALSLKF